MYPVPLFCLFILSVPLFCPLTPENSRETEKRKTGQGEFLMEFTLPRFPPDIIIARPSCRRDSLRPRGSRLLVLTRHGQTPRRSLRALTDKSKGADHRLQFY